MKNFSALIINQTTFGCRGSKLPLNYSLNPVNDVKFAHLQCFSLIPMITPKSSLSFIFESLFAFQPHHLQVKH